VGVSVVTLQTERQKLSRTCIYWQATLCGALKSQNQVLRVMWKNRLQARVVNNWQVHTCLEVVGLGVDRALT